MSVNEHIITLSINLDDNRIREIAEESAAKQIVEDVYKKESPGYYRNNRGYAIENIADKVIEKVADDVKASMMDAIADAVASKLARSKAFREMVTGKIAEKEAER